MMSEEITVTEMKHRTNAAVTDMLAARRAADEQRAIAQGLEAHNDMLQEGIKVLIGAMYSEACTALDNDIDFRYMNLDKLAARVLKESGLADYIATPKKNH